MLHRLRQIFTGDSRPPPVRMTPLSQRWVEHPAPPDDWSVDLLRKVRAEHAPLASRLLFNRGIRDSEASRAYLTATPGEMRDPHELPGIDAAVDRIFEAHDARQQVTIHGDFDTDGVTATAIMVLALRRIGIHVDYYLPSRERHGRGVSTHAIREIHARGTGLIVTVDTGISAYAQVELASELGMDVIITDHHIPPDQLPAAAAIVNPHLAPPELGLAQYSGAGVALKLALALWQRAGIDEGAQLVPLAAVGTLADRVSLTGDNRTVCKIGLRGLERKAPLGLRTLVKHIIERTRTEHEMNSEFVGFALAPRLNAPGRIGPAGVCVELLTTNDRRQAKALALQIDDANLQRRRAAALALEAVQPQLKRAMRANYNVVMLEADSDTGAGILGLLAGTLSSQTQRPTVVYRVQGDTARASIRAVDGDFDVHAALKGISGRLTAFGGHKAAAGFTASIHHLDAIATHLEQRAAVGRSGGDNGVSGNHRRRYDAEVRLDQLDDSMRRFVGPMEPFGTDNDRPRFLIRGTRVVSHHLWQPPPLPQHIMTPRYRVKMVEGYEHIVGELRDASGGPIPFTAFRLGWCLPLPKRVDVIVSLGYDRYHGRDHRPRERRRLEVHDFGPSTLP